MMEMIDYWIYIEIPYHEPFTVRVRHQVVRECPVNRKWMIGKPWDVVKKWIKKNDNSLLRLKSKIKVVKKQYYLI